MPSLFVSAARAFGLSLASLLGFSTLAQHEVGGKQSYIPKISAASDDAEKAIKRFQIPPGFKVELWAAEPDVAQGVCLYPDYRGRVFVCETFRLHAGVPDIRGIMDWLDEDLACRTPDDRLAEMKRHLGPKFADYSIHSDRVRLLWDSTGRGRADKSTVFAEGFNQPLDGIMAGVIARGNDVWVANIPDLWHLRDTNGDGLADTRESLSHGYGVRVGFLGHDLHGLTFGPDGRLYFSIGDRGANIVQDGRHIGHPDTGSVFRCNPDGTELEEFAYGLRNPQELVFDDLGNLFTGDNNSDGGDQARWVYLVEGGDSGWRIGWQFLENRNAPNPRGPWNSEKMWHPQNDDQPAYIIPPIKNISAGPSGVSFYPGTGLPESWNGTFTLVDFRGSASGSGVWNFKLKPKGASFELVDDQKFIWSILATDGEWGPDGSFYLMDWVQGWDQNGHGRIYRMYETNAVKSPVVAETRKLLAAGMNSRPPRELARLLRHPDRRVRQEAQFALAERGEASIKTLSPIASGTTGRLPRLHAIWALGQIARTTRNTTQGGVIPALEPLMALLADSDEEVRANAARVLGDARYGRAFDVLLKLTSDPNPHVRSLGTLALARLGRPEAVPSVVALLRENADRDPVLRHAGVVALAATGNAALLATLATHESDGVRMGALLALRRLGRAEAADFLNDKSERIVSEAAHAISDEPISGAMPELAALISRPVTAQPLLRRVLNANYRYGTRDTASALAQYSAASSAPESGRVEALQSLAEWPKDSGRDRVTGMWRPTSFVRDSKIPAEALRPVVTRLILEAPNRVRAAAATAVGALSITEAAPALAELVRKAEGDANSRVAALRALESLHASELAESVQVATADAEENVRKVALQLSVLIGNGQSAAAPVAKPVRTGTFSKFNEVLEKGSLSEKQNVFATVADISGDEADAFLSKWMTELIAGRVPPGLQLDVLEASAKRNAATVKSLVAKYESGLKPGDDLAPFRVCLQGGNPDEGRRIFIERADVSCVRCHKVNGEGGEVGPDLAGIINRHPREYLLESVLFPNKAIAQGFEGVLLTLKDGRVYAGIIKSEKSDELELNSPEDGLVTVKRADIKSRDKGLSAMPEGMTNILSRTDLRNLVEFLATLK
jgi:quinoprotein glucose dehydrogenase